MTKSWWETFHKTFEDGNRIAIEVVLETIAKTSRKEGLREAATIAAVYDLDNRALDATAREIAREIMLAGEM